MSAEQFKQRLAECNSQRQVELLLQGWAFVKATLSEYQQLREEVIGKVESLRVES